ncbi:PREDICTED: uncharacterized protein LOC108379824 [Rhagoletis zephyria]|uniref:uncharacterized protein LOC108379824 n=1 Tax=Rhagoletis zephyria TaxID=28612 RepID=UPI0008115A06|nr:PREDICTED: uncharacterized protein LOC108379824 [Rhagoletis zephyria]
MGRHKNAAQEAIMINFMQQYPGIACGTIQCKQKRNALWEALAEKLNSRGPPKKPMQRWKKVWIDWRAAVRRKIMFEKIEANASVAQDDETLYKKTTLSPAEGELARICKLFEADVDIDNSSDVQEDSSPISEGTDTIVKDELVFDEEDDENSKDYDVAVAACEDRSNEKSTEAENISVRDFAQCPTSSGLNIKVDSSEDKVEIKKRKIDATATEESDDLIKILRQQATVISTITKFLTENVNLQTENFRVMNEIRQGLKEVCKSIKTLSDVTNDNLKEQRRHNYEIEKLQREEVLLAKQQLELEELKVFGNRMHE